MTILNVIISVLRNLVWVSQLMLHTILLKCVTEPKTKRRRGCREVGLAQQEKKKKKKRSIVFHASRAVFIKGYTERALR